MKYLVVPTSQFKKDLKKISKQRRDLNLLNDIVNKLANGQELETCYKDHNLRGNYVGFRECYIQSDWLLIYKVSAGKLILTLSRTGSHSDLF